MSVWLWVFIITFVVHIIIAFFMSPPTFLADKFFSKFELHPKLDGEKVSFISINGVEINGEDKERFIQEFNEANFLFNGGFQPELDQNPILVQIQQGKQQYTMSMYIYGDQIEILRHKKKKYVPYRIQAPRLLQRLLSLREAV
jgi:hypothetical protein